LLFFINIIYSLLIKMKYTFEKDTSSKKSKSSVYEKVIPLPKRVRRRHNRDRDGDDLAFLLENSLKL